MRRTDSMRCLGLSILAVTLLLGPNARAEGGTKPQPDAAATPKETAPPSSPSGVLVGAKIGSILPVSGASPNARVGLDLGYVFPQSGQHFGALLQVDYASPKAEGSGVDPRVPSGGYNWRLSEQLLAFTPMFSYRVGRYGALTPFVNVGPRIYFLQTNITGSVGPSAIAETTEQSTALGGALSAGTEVALGPGALTGELMFEYASLSHRSTGSSSTGALNLMVGYRLFPMAKRSP